MRLCHALLKCINVERLWLAAFLAFYQGSTQHLKFGKSFPFLLDQILNAFAVIGEPPGFNLGLNPIVLLFCQRNRFLNGSHSVFPQASSNYMAFHYHAFNIAQMGSD
jgi:hypothetical protein